ncbi:MAG: hypothetical protein ACP5PN_00480 [Steroidobacteraceae bacterium]
MIHTYLLQPGIWTGNGTFWREDGELLPAECRTEVAHQDECWLVAGSLKVLGSPPVEFRNAYSIEPPAKKGGCLRWTSENATLGKVQGTFSVLERCILSVYSCGAAGYHGAEHYGRVDADHYQASGVLLLEARRLSSWEILLTREPAPATGSSADSDRAAAPRTATSDS